MMHHKERTLLSWRSKIYMMCDVKVSHFFGKEKLLVEEVCP
jgi:hypothetical protein